MISGQDIIIPTAGGTAALDMAVRALTRLWPQGVLQDAVSGDGFRRYADINFAGRHEILAFRDSQSAKLWDELGPDASLDGTLIHFLLSNTDLTVAIDSYPPPEIKSFVDHLRKGINQAIFAITAKQGANRITSPQGVGKRPLQSEGHGN